MPGRNEAAGVRGREGGSALVGLGSSIRKTQRPPCEGDESQGLREVRE